MKAKQINAAAKKLIAKHGLINLTRSGLCEAAGIPDGSFPHVMGCTFSEYVAGLSDGMGCTAQVTRKRTSPALRKCLLLATAAECAKTHGYFNMTREQVAVAAKCSTGLVTHHLGTMPNLRRSVMRHAIRNNMADIVAQGLANKDKHAQKAPDELKQKALATL